MHRRPDSFLSIKNLAGSKLYDLNIFDRKKGNRGKNFPHAKEGDSFFAR